MKRHISLKAIPLYFQIAIAILLAIGVGLLAGAGHPNPDWVPWINNLVIPCNLVLKALRTLATPLILLAVLHVFLTATIPGRSGRRLFGLLLTNTIATIAIGLLVANVLKPGRWWGIAVPASAATSKSFDPWGLLQDMVPPSIV